MKVYAKASLLCDYTCVSFLKSLSPEAEKMTKTNIRKKIWVIWLSQKILSMCLTVIKKNTKKHLDFKYVFLAT